jgi:hypothetical protein
MRNLRDFFSGKLEYLNHFDSFRRSIELNFVVAGWRSNQKVQEKCREASREVMTETIFEEKEFRFDTNN